MTPKQLTHYINMTGLGRRELAQMLGYKSDGSIRACEAGKTKLPQDKARWLEAFAKMCAEQDAGVEAWLKANPPPTGTGMDRKQG